MAGSQPPGAVYVEGERPINRGVETRRLLGRERELAVLHRLLDVAREDHGAVLVVHGEPGVGKTALLAAATAAASEFRVFKTAGVEGDMAIDYAVLQQLCSPLLGLADRLPTPQRDALAVAFGLQAGRAPNPLLVGLAVLGLMAENSRDQPVLAIIDDAQWLDRASARALGLVARRLLAERVVLVFATREAGNGLGRLPQLAVEPLGHRDARALLESVLPARLDDSVLERIVLEAGGNPLALLELPRGMSPAQLAGGFGLPSALPLANGIEDSFRRRFANLPADARRLLLLAAAEPLGDPALLGRTAKRLGIPEATADAVESEGLLTFNGAVTFRHPLVRSAIYGAAEPGERLEAHRALADATDPETDPDRRAWHRAQGALLPDEELAAELEHSAATAQARGGLAAAAAFLARAVELSPDPSDRARRALAAAQTKFQSGALEDALDLSQAAEPAAADQEVSAHLHLLRAQIAFAARRGSDATPLLLEAARQLEPVNPVLARATYLEALSAATFAGRLAKGEGALDVARATLAGPPMPESPRPTDFLLQGMSLRLIEGYASGAPLIKRALKEFQRADVISPEDARWLWFASSIALYMWDDAAWKALSTRHLEMVRETGELSILPLVLTNRSSVYAFLGELRTAELLEEEAEAAVEATGIAAAPYGPLTIAAVRGHEDAFSSLIRNDVRNAAERGEGLALTVAEFLSGTLYNGLGRYDDALVAVGPAEQFVGEGPAIWSLTELIEAAVRSGQPERARSAFELVEETTRAAGTDWAIGIEARSGALLTDGDDADALYQKAIERLGRTSIRVQLARTHLLYGEWLRRERRRRDARTELRTAHEMFQEFGVDGFAERARLELEATGEHARKRTTEALGQLTKQETQIARLVVEGHANREIASRLFISPRTVEYHLHKVFRKLGVKSRTQLARHLE